MSPKTDVWIARSIFVFLVTVTEPATGCQPAYETFVTNFTANATHLIVYDYPKCPPNFVVDRILAAEMRRTASTSKESINITEYVSPGLSSCVGDTGATSCVFYDPPKELANSSATDIGKIRPPEIVVNYTCRAKLIFRGGYMAPSHTSANMSTDSVTYILTEMMVFGLDWRCTLSSSSEVAVRWWTVAAGTCNLNQSLKCTGGNGSDVTNVDQNVSSDLCMKAQSIVLIRFFANVLCTNMLDILLDVQVPRGSELDISCSPEAPPNLSTTALALMKASCSALLWTAPTSRTASSSTARPVSAIASSEQPTKTSPAPVIKRIDVQGLAMGFGLGLGVFVVLVASVAAIVCLRKSSRSKRESKANLNCSEAAADDAGFVPADDVFTCKSFYHRTETPGNDGAANVQVIRQTENHLESSVPDILLPSSSTTSPASPPPPLPPSSSEPGKGRGKQPRTLTKKVFTQIAETAKQEERKNGKSKRKSVANKGTSRGKQETEVDCEPSSYADVWLYSSTLSGINSALFDRVDFPRQSATEL